MSEESSGSARGWQRKELADAMLRRVDEIASRLLSRLRTSQGYPPALTQATCVAWISEALNQLNIGDPANGLGPPPATSIKSTRELWEVLTAHKLLRRILNDEAAELIGRPLQSDESMALSAAISNSASEAVLIRADQINRKTRTQAETYSLHLHLLSHQLHGGLNGLLMMLEVLKGDLLDRSDVSTAISDLNLLSKTIVETSETLDALMEDINLQTNRVEPVDLAELASETAEQLQSAPAAKHWHISYHAEAGDIVASNRALLNIVLQQLATYVLRRGKGGTLRLEAVASEDGGGRIEITYDKPLPGAPELAQLISRADPGLLTPVSQLTIARHAAELLKARLHAIFDPSGTSRLAIEIPPPAK